MTSDTGFKYRKPPAQSTIATPTQRHRRPRVGWATRQLFEKQEEHLTQAERIFRKFGGARGLMRALKGIGHEWNPSSIYRWNYPREKGGSGGLIPTAAWPALLQAARVEGVHLASEEFDPRETYRFRRKIVATIGADGIERPFIPIAKLREQAAKVERKRQKQIADKEKTPNQKESGDIDDIFG